MTKPLVRWTKVVDEWCIWSREELDYNREVEVTKMNGETRSVHVGHYVKQDNGGYVYLVKKVPKKPKATKVRKGVYKCPECGGKMTKIGSISWNCENCGPGFGNPWA